MISDRFRTDTLTNKYLCTALARRTLFWYYVSANPPRTLRIYKFLGAVPTAVEKKREAASMKDRRIFFYIDGQAISIERLRDRGTRWYSRVRSHSKGRRTKCMHRAKSRNLFSSCEPEISISLMSDFEIGAHHERLSAIPILVGIL